MRAPLLLAVLLCAGCPSTPVPPLCGVAGIGGAGTGGSGAFGQDSQLLQTGQQANVTMQLQPSAGCDSVTPATGVDTSVQGPDDMPVTSTHSMPLTPSDLSMPYTTVIAFTPTQPGYHHLFARFQPNLGIAQLDLLAVLDQSWLPAYATYDATLVDTCESYAVTSLGALLCIADTVRVFRNGALVDTRPGLLAAVRDDSVWLATGSNDVSHFVDTGSDTLMAATPAGFHVMSGVVALVPFGDEVLVLTPGDVERFAPVNGAFVQTQRWSTGNMSAGAADGNAVLFADSATVWVSVDGGAPRALTDDNSQVVGYGPEGIWTLDMSGGFALFAPGLDAPIATLAALPSAPAVSRSRGFGAAPLVTPSDGVISDTLAATFVDGQVVLVDWGATGDSSFVTANWAALASATPDDEGPLVVKKRTAP